MELQDFKKRAAEAVYRLRNEHSELLKDLDRAASRVERVEREMDYVETRSSPRACTNEADKVLEQEAWRMEESSGGEEEEEELYSTVSGELLTQVWKMTIVEKILQLSLKVSILYLHVRSVYLVG